MSVTLTLQLKKFNFEAFILLLVILMTPAQIEIKGSDYAPSLFTFCFMIVFEQNFSLRSLRPLLISLPMTMILLSIHLSVKKKFF